MTGRAQSLEAHLQRELGKGAVRCARRHPRSVHRAARRGHVLLEGPPGVGKTLLGKSFAQTLGGNYRRVQARRISCLRTSPAFTSTTPGVPAFEFQPGPVFADVLLVDEINRSGPKTQSALLEAMQERQVTVDRETFR